MQLMVLRTIWIIQIFLPDSSGIIVSEDVAGFLEEKSIEVHSIISEADAIQIREFIDTENMLKRPVGEIYYSANKYGCVKLTMNAKMAGFMCLYNFSGFFEAGTLCVWKEYRGLGLGKILQKILINNFSYLPIFLVTSKDKVKYISQGTGMIELQVKDLPKEFLKVIKEGGRELNINKKIFVNERFKNIFGQTFKNK